MKQGRRVSKVVNARLLGKGIGSALWAVEFRREKIFRIGRQTGFLRRSASALVLDALGKLILPGFTDHHLHPFALGAKSRTVDLKNCRSIVQLQDRMKRFVCKGSRQNPWLVGRGWDQELFEEKRLPDRRDLDQVCPESPVLVERICGHVGVVNSAALRRATLSSFPEELVPRNQVEEYTGLVKEGALDHFRSLIPSLTKTQLEHDFQVAQAEALSNGCAGLHCILSENWKKELAAIKDLDRTGKLIIALTLFLPANSIEEYEKMNERAFRGRHFRVAGFKLFADGSLGARTAALEEPYADDPENRGVLQLTASDIEIIAKKVKSIGKILATHAIGDRAVREVIQGYERAGIKKSDRFRIEHCSLIRKGSLQKLNPYVISVQPTFVISDYWLRDRIGKTVEVLPYPFKSILENATMIGGSDSPVESQSPLEGIRSAINNPIAEESLSSTEAVGIYSEGCLVKGKNCGVVVLDSDEICKAKVRALILAGRIVYSTES